MTGVATTTSTANAEPPLAPDCLLLGAGSTGLPFVGGQVPSLSGFLGGGAGIGPVADGVRLPDRVIHEDGRHAISNEYVFALRSGDLYVRRAREGRPLAKSTWHELQLPSCLQGRITTVSADYRLMTVVDTDGRLYSHDMPGGDLSPERWTWRWGPFLWLGAGMNMPGKVRDWSISEFNGAETFTDSGGRQHNAIGVATGYLLRSDRRTITYIDPWLPSDESREVCGPRRGQLRLASLDASGSTLLVAGTDGSLWTRLYDFDVAGGNSLLGKYTWADKTADPALWQLPPVGWTRQPAPRGVVTDQVTIVRTGTDAKDRELRVTGRDRSGRVGYWRKQINATEWQFVATGGRLVGRVLDGRRSLAPSLDRRYVGTIAGAPATVEAFDSACSGSRVVVRIGKERLKLRLHSEDALRQTTRAAGLDDVPRHYNAALEVPRKTWRRLPSASPAVREFVAANLTGRITSLPIAVTATRLRMRYQCWELTLDGKPARPDALGNPVDVGTLLGFLRDAPEQQALPLC